MKELVSMLEDLVDKYGIAEEDITPIAEKIGELVGPAAAEELGGGEGEDEENEFADLEG